MNAKNVKNSVTLLVRQTDTIETPHPDQQMPEQTRAKKDERWDDEFSFGNFYRADHQPLDVLQKKDGRVFDVFDPFQCVPQEAWR